MAARAALAAADINGALKLYCVTCHNDRLKTGGFTLEGVDASEAGRHADALEKAARKLLVGAMPPMGAPRPAPDTLRKLTAALESSLDAAANTRDPGRAILRRLNRTEYANAIRDLLDLRVDVSSMLPFDNSSYGFDNIADVLGMSPVLMEQYLTAARRISALAVGDPVEIITTADTYRAKPDLSQDRHLDGLPLGTRGGVVVDHVFPLDAEVHVQSQSTAGDVEQRGRIGVSPHRRADGGRRGSSSGDDWRPRRPGDVLREFAGRRREARGQTRDAAAHHSRATSDWGHFHREERRHAQRRLAAVSADDVRAGELYGSAAHRGARRDRSLQRHGSRKDAEPPADLRVHAKSGR